MKEKKDNMLLHTKKQHKMNMIVKASTFFFHSFIFLPLYHTHFFLLTLECDFHVAEGGCGSCGWF